MIGYIYLTENKINGRKYVGKHLSKEYDKSYLGSGKILEQAIRKYGKDNFSNSIIYQAETLDELNSAEIFFIELYRNIYGKKMYNIANGGDGGDVFKYASESDKLSFKNKMKVINKERCNSEDFKLKISRATSKRFSDEAERVKQSKTIRKAWSNPELIRRQREKLLAYYTSHKKDNSYNCKPCILEFEGEVYEFDSRKDLDRFLKNKLNITLGRKIETQLLLSGEPYNPFHKNKHKRLIGMRIYYKQQDENVETIGDECNQVGCEIGTHSKRKTEIEEIVRSA